ncbi:MAG: fasciclin domain-containing protein [Limnothrix sp.]
MRSTVKTLAVGFGLALCASVSLPTLTQAGEMSADGSMKEVAQSSEMMPESVMMAPSIVDIAAGQDVFSTLVAALTAGDLVDTLSGEGPFTVFAPTDAAFAALPEGTVEMLLLPENKALLQKILTYHVVSGSITSGELMAGAVPTVEGSDLMVSLSNGVKVNNANVVTADIMAGNGVIHVIDAVIMPPEAQAKKPPMPSSNSMTEVADTSKPMVSSQSTSIRPIPLNIVELAAGNDTFSTLVAAVTAGDLVETLSGKGPFTVFAPTNAAFAALPEGTVEMLLMPENKALLQKILTYHVVSGSVTSMDLRAGAVPTVQGGNIMVSLDDGVQVNDANVVAADIVLSNGVIHVIDEVIMPADE